MIELMERVAFQEELELRSSALGVSPYEALILASMIEREAKVDGDRALIARVIYNRLELGMNLEIDATLYYDSPPDTPFVVLRAKILPTTLICTAGYHRRRLQTPVEHRFVLRLILHRTPHREMTFARS